MEQSFDLIVVGAGPGGYVAAIRAAQLGLRTAIVERERLGGICLNWGCIPTKALLRSSEIAHILDSLPDYGFEGPRPWANLDRAVARSRAVADRLSRGVDLLMRKHGIEVVAGEAQLIAPGRLAVSRDGENRTLEAAHIILATGARARLLPELATEDPRVWTYRQALQPDLVPKRLLVVGSGAIGMEFASFFADLRSEVTVVEALDRVLPNEDHEISAAARDVFRRQGMNFHTGAMVTELVCRTDYVRASIVDSTGERRARFDRVILATGITGNTENLGLETLGVAVTRGHVSTDEWCRTNVPGIYAIGDLAGPPWLAHKASHEAVLCVEKIAGLAEVHPLAPAHVPSCTYCRPQIASIGLSEEAAAAAGHTPAVGRFPFRANGRALAYGSAEGFVKTVFDRDSGRLLGAHMIGPDVTELVQGFAIALQMKATQRDLRSVIFPHPTLSEAMHEASLEAFGEVIYI